MQDFDLYKLVLEEYRFQVQLNWDRTKFFLTLNLTLIATTAALLKLDRISALSALVLFFLGLFVAIAGNQSLVKGHQYYRSIALKKAQLENSLGIEPKKAISSTVGQKEARRYLGQVDVWIGRRLRIGSITAWISNIFWMLALLNVLGIFQAFYLSFRP